MPIPECERTILSLTEIYISYKIKAQIEIFHIDKDKRMKKLMVVLALMSPVFLCRAMENQDIQQPATILYEVVVGGNLEEVKLALQGVSDIDASVNGRGPNALYIAAQEGHEEVVRLLLEKGANLSLRWRQNKLTPLKVAVLFDRRAVAELLLKKEFEKTGSASLCVACYLGCYDIVKELIEKNPEMILKAKAPEICQHINHRQMFPFNERMKSDSAPAYVKKFGRTCSSLIWAILGEQPEIVELLLSYKEKAWERSHQVTQQRAGYVMKAMCWCVKSIPPLYKFMERVGFVDLVNEHFLSPLMIASYMGNGPIVKLLLDHGANYEKRSVCDISPLHFAMQHIDSEAFRHLLDQYPDISTCQDDLLEMLRPSVRFLSHISTVTDNFPDNAMNEGTDAIINSVLCKLELILSRGVKLRTSDLKWIAHSVPQVGEIFFQEAIKREVCKQSKEAYDKVKAFFFSMRHLRENGMRMHVPKDIVKLMLRSTPESALLVLRGAAYADKYPCTFDKVMTRAQSVLSEDLLIDTIVACCYKRLHNGGVLLAKTVGEDIYTENTARINPQIAQLFNPDTLKERLPGLIRKWFFSKNDVRALTKS